MSRLRDMVREHEVVREHLEDGDGSGRPGVMTMLGISYGVQQFIPESHLLLTEDLESLYEHNEKTLRHELMYAMVGDVHSELVILRMKAYSLLRANMKPTVEADEAIKEIIKCIGDIIEGLEV